MTGSKRAKTNEGGRQISESYRRTKFTAHEVRLALVLFAERMSQRKVAAEMTTGRTIVSGNLMRKKPAELAAENTKMPRRVWREGLG